MFLWIIIVFNINCNVPVSAQELLNAFNYTSCDEIQTCSLCALIDECSYCVDKCQYIDQECLDGEAVEATPGCTDFEAVSMIGFDKNEKLTYRFHIDFCETVEEENDNDTLCVQQTRDIAFWVEYAQNQTMTYSLFAKLLNLKVNQQSVIQSNDSARWPVCSVEIKHGVVKEIICPNITKIEDEFFIQYEDESDKNVDLNKVISQSILMTLRELLPRIDTLLYDKNKHVAENTPNGKSFERRTKEDNILHEQYGIDDFSEWNPYTIPRKLNFSHDLEVNRSNHHVQKTKGWAVISLKLADQMFFEDIEYELSLIQLDVLSEQDMDYMSRKFQSDSTYNADDYYSKTFTLKEWRKASFFEDPTDIGWEFFDNEGNQFDPGTTGTHFNLGNNRRRNLGFDGLKYTLFHYDEDKVNEDILGINVVVNVFSEISIGIPYKDDPSAGEVVVNGCSGLGDWVAGLSQNHYNDITECCNNHDRNYANCQMTKTDADNRLFNCVNNYDTGVGELIRSGIEDIPISYIYYMRANWKYCDIDLTGNPLKAEFAATVKIGGATIFRASYGYSDTDKNEVASKDLFKIHLGGACIFIYIGFACFELWASIDLNMRAFHDLNGASKYVGFEPFVGMGLSADLYAELLGLARVGLLLRGDIIQLALPVKLHINEEEEIIVTADLETRVAVLTASTYYRLRKIDAGCRCTGCWVCCPTCWFRITWSGYHTFWTKTWVFGGTNTINLLTWKPFPTDGDPVWKMEGVDVIQIYSNRRRILLNRYDVVKPNKADIMSLLQINPNSMKYIAVRFIKLSTFQDVIEYELKVQIMFYENDMALFAKNKYEGQEYRNGISSIISSKNGNVPVNAQLVQVVIIEDVLSPSVSPTMDPTTDPTNAPTFAPSTNPTLAPSNTPTNAPTLAPSINPTLAPSKTPTSPPSHSPTSPPTLAPTDSPTFCYNNMNQWNVDIIGQSTKFKLYSNCQRNTFIQVECKSLIEIEGKKGRKTNNKVTSFSSKNVNGYWITDENKMFNNLQAIRQTFVSVIDYKNPIDFNLTTLLFYDKKGGDTELNDGEIIEENTFKWFTAVKDWPWLSSNNSLELCIDIMSNNNYKQNKDHDHTTYNLNDDFIFDLDTSTALCIDTYTSEQKPINVLVQKKSDSCNHIHICFEYPFCDGTIVHDPNTIYSANHQTHKAILNDEINAKNEHEIQTESRSVLSSSVLYTVVAGFGLLTFIVCAMIICIWKRFDGKLYKVVKEVKMQNGINEGGQDESMVEVTKETINN